MSINLKFILKIITFMQFEYSITLKSHSLHNHFLYKILLLIYYSYQIIKMYVDRGVRSRGAEGAYVSKQVGHMPQM